MAPITSGAMATAAVDTDAIPLPGILATIEEIAGRDAALQLAGEKGGCEVYLPSPARLDPDYWLVKLLGQSAASAICRHFVMHERAESRVTKGGGVRLHIPTAAVVMRRLQVRWLTIAGASTTQIARQLGMTTRGVERIRMKLRAAGEID
jgi:hypothetical protein